MAYWMHVGDHLGTAIRQRRPFVPGGFEEAEIFGTVHPRARSLTKDCWLDQHVLAVLQALEQAVGALRLFGGAPDDAADQKELRVVAAMAFGMDRFHAEAPWVAVGISRTSFATSRHATRM